MKADVPRASALIIIPKGLKTGKKARDRVYFTFCPLAGTARNALARRLRLHLPYPEQTQHQLGGRFGVLSLASKRKWCII